MFLLKKRQQRSVVYTIQKYIQFIYIYYTLPVCLFPINGLTDQLNLLWRFTWSQGMVKILNLSLKKCRFIFIFENFVLQCACALGSTAGHFFYFQLPGVLPINITKQKNPKDLADFPFLGKIKKKIWDIFKTWLAAPNLYGRVSSHKHLFTSFIRKEIRWWTFKLYQSSWLVLWSHPKYANIPF